MAKVWFRRRARVLGVGYGVVSLEGMIVLIAFIALFYFTALLGMTWAARSPIAVGLSKVVVIAAILLEVGALFWLVRVKSDDGQG